MERTLCPCKKTLSCMLRSYKTCPCNSRSFIHGSGIVLTCSMSAQDIWARKYHELWEKLESNTKDSFCTALWKWIVSFFWLTNLAKFNCHARSPLHHTGLVQRQMLFLEDLLAEMVAKNSKDPFGNIRVARKALSKIRCVPLIASSPFTVCHLFAWNLVKVAGSW